VQGAAGPDAQFYVPKLLYAAFIGAMSGLAVLLFAAFCILLKTLKGEDVAMMKKILGKARIPAPAIAVLSSLAASGVARGGRRRA
jgi:hypothetical protein